MAELAKHPYEGYTLYKVYHKGEKRMMAQLVKSRDDRTTMAYARYLMSVKLGRFLTKEEEVDHIDDNKQNDNIDNLQILTRKENHVKWTKTVSRKMRDMVCPICHISFQIEERNAKFRPNATCSRRCGGIKSHRN